jgi:hypothetical protein
MAARRHPEVKTMSNQRSSSRVRGAACLLWLALPFVLAGALPAAAESWTTPVVPELWNNRLEIGPVPGLTTTWHPAPVRTAIPLGATVQLRIRVPLTAFVSWTGAREIAGGRGSSTAEVSFNSVGTQTVTAFIQDPTHVDLRQETIVFDVVNTTIPATVGYEPVSLSEIRLTADSVVIDPQNPNESSHTYFLRGSSIAALRQVGEGHYSTSIGRSLVLEAAIEPSGFAPLVEWRLDGVPQRQLGSPARLEIYTTGPHTLSAGPLGAEKQIQIDAYLVLITSHVHTDVLSDGVPVTFRAKTDPPGYEDDITWLASTTFGSAQPLMGTGPEFTTVFADVAASTGGGLGVRADNAVVHLDQVERATTFSPLACTLAARTDFFAPEEISSLEGMCKGTAAIEPPECWECPLQWATCNFEKCAAAGGGEGIDAFLSGLHSGCNLNLDDVLNCSLAFDYCNHRCKPPDIIPIPSP